MSPVRTSVTGSLILAMTLFHSPTLASCEDATDPQKRFQSLAEVKSFCGIAEEDGPDGYRLSDTETEDLNGDGKPEIMLEGNQCNRNCEHILLTQDREGYRILDTFGGQYLGPTKLPEVVHHDPEITFEHQGFKNIHTINQGGWGTGTIAYKVYDGERYIPVISVNYDFEGLADSIADPGSTNTESTSTESTSTDNN